MRLTDQQVVVANIFHQTFGLPELVRNPDNSINLNESNRIARKWTQKLVQQMHYCFRKAGFVWKSAGGGRPESTDVIAIHKDNIFVGWDVIPGQGTDNQSFNAEGESEDLRGQVPLPQDPVNHCGLQAFEGDGTDDGNGNGNGNNGGGNGGVIVLPAELIGRLNAIDGQLSDLNSGIRHLTMTIIPILESIGGHKAIIEDIQSRTMIIDNFIQGGQLRAMFREEASKIRPRIFSATESEGDLGGPEGNPKTD